MNVLFVCLFVATRRRLLQHPAGVTPVQSTAQQDGKWMVLAGLSDCELVVMAACLWACGYMSLSVRVYVCLWACGYMILSVSLCVCLWGCSYMSLSVNVWFGTFLSPPPAWCPPVLLVLVLASLFQSSRRLSIFTCSRVLCNTAVHFNIAVQHFSAVQCSAVQCSAVHFNTAVQYFSAVQYHSQFSVLKQCSAVKQSSEVQSKAFTSFQLCYHYCCYTVD